MGYYTESDNVYAEEYNVIRASSDKISYPSKVRIIEKPQIIIINNEDITFNLENYILTYYHTVIASQQENKIETESSNEFIEIEKSETVSPYEKIKIKINFGDGKSETLIKPLTHKNFILNGVSSWAITKHHYAFTDKKYFENTQYITLEIKNIEGIVDKVIIPFKVLSSLAADYDLKMELLSANLTNNNDVSFVFNILGNNQIVFATDKEKS